MKSTKFDKKLRLNKTTVSSLGDRNMKEVKGGALSVTICKTCGDECTIYTVISCIPRYC
jgi:hypothetical protein